MREIMEGSYAGKIIKKVRKSSLPLRMNRTEWETRTSESPPKGMEAGVLTCQLRVVFG